MEKTVEVIKYWAKALAGSVCRYQLEERPILILGTRRSGSTLLMRMIYSQPGLDYVDQPLDLWHYHPYKGQLPVRPLNRYTLLSPEERTVLRPFFDEVLSGRKRLRHQWNPLDRHFSWVVHRLVLKELNLKDLELIECLSEKCDIVFLIRHPIPVALSIIKQQWGNTARVFLENKQYSDLYLERSEIKEYAKILDTGTRLEQYVLEWCMENAPLLQHHANKPWLTVTYEELLFRPKRMVEMICNRLGLPDASQMLATVQTPSRTTSSDSRQMINREGSNSRATQWMERVSPQERSSVQRILDTMNINAYSASEVFPREEMLRFGRFAEGNHTK